MTRYVGLIVVTLAVIAVACSSPSNSHHPAWGRVSGHVYDISRPNRPGALPAQPDLPPGIADVRLNLMNKQESHIAITDHGGAYAIDLPPGTYRIRLEPSAGIFRILAVYGPTQVAVEPGQRDRVDLRVEVSCPVCDRPVVPEALPVGG